MVVTNSVKETLLRAMLDDVVGADGHNGLSRLLAEPRSEEDRAELLHAAINVLNEMNAFVQLLEAGKTV
jgi:hypothetical protein